MKRDDQVMLSVGDLSGPTNPVGPEPPESPHAGPIEWHCFLIFASPLEGHIVAGQLETEGVPTFVEVNTLCFDGTPGSILWVPLHLLHRARWILSWPPVSEAELDFLATGELGPESDDQESALRRSRASS